MIDMKIKKGGKIMAKKQDTQKILNIKSFLKGESNETIKIESVATYEVETADGVVTLEFPISPVRGISKLKEEYIKKHEQPTPKSYESRLADLSNPARVIWVEKKDEVKKMNNPKTKWIKVYDIENDLNYQLEIGKYLLDIQILGLMEMWGFENEYGLEKLEEFKEKIYNWGITDEIIKDLDDKIKNLVRPS